MIEAHPLRRHFVIAFVILVVAGAAWAGLWYYGSGVAEDAIAGWKAREAQAGRLYTCSEQTIGGFPFGIEMRCADPGAEFRSNQPPLALTAGDMLVSARVWQPTTLTTEFAGPLTIAEPGQPAKVEARWRHAQTQVHGLPTSPERVVIAVERPMVTSGAGGDRLFGAELAELDGRLVSGSVQANPVIEIALKLVAATAPRWHPAAATPVDADITAVLRGLKDFSPKPWPARFRELQAAGGRIEITHARVQQRDTIAVASGALGLSPAGRLNGQLDLTVANLDQFLPTLGLDRMLSPEQASPKVNEAFDKLDRLIPGLGAMARQNAAPMISAGVALMGQATELEGKRAVILPLRFDDGMVSLGPLKVGAVPPLF